MPAAVQPTLEGTVERWPDAPNQGGAGCCSSSPVKHLLAVADLASIPRRVRHRAANLRCCRSWCRGFRGHRRRELLPRRLGFPSAGWIVLGRLHGHAGDSHELPGARTSWTAKVSRLGQTAIAMGQVAEPSPPRRAIRHMEKGSGRHLWCSPGRTVLSTDTCAAQRALETGCEVVLMAKSVDGVYDSDPRTNPDAKRYDRLTYDDVLTQDLKVADATAISLAATTTCQLSFSIS